MLVGSFRLCALYVGSVFVLLFFLSLSLFLSFWLAVRLWVVGCPPVASRPKVGGPVGWLFAPVGLIAQLICYVVGCSRLGACITVDFTFC